MCKYFSHLNCINPFSFIVIFRVKIGDEEVDTIQVEQGGVYSVHIAKVQIRRKIFSILLIKKRREGLIISVHSSFSHYLYI
jgi:hypothetical protein